MHCLYLGGKSVSTGAVGPSPVDVCLVFCSAGEVRFKKLTVQQVKANDKVRSVGTCCRCAMFNGRAAEGRLGSNVRVYMFMRHD